MSSDEFGEWIRNRAQGNFERPSDFLSNFAGFSNTHKRKHVEVVSGSNCVFLFHKRMLDFLISEEVLIRTLFSFKSDTIVAVIMDCGKSPGELHAGSRKAWSVRMPLFKAVCFLLVRSFRFPIIHYDLFIRLVSLSVRQSLNPMLGWPLNV